MAKGKDGVYGKYIKRILDIMCATLALIVLGIPMLLVAALIKRNMGSPVIFKQHRIGKDNKEFILLKFRSMTDARDENGIYLPDEQRITKLGRFIRNSSVDELPSLLNILRGEMSVIGPRPEPSRYLSRYTAEQIRRHEVRPGLSSPATTNGRNAQSWEQQFAGDVWYVDNLSLSVDIGSVLNTIKIVLTHEGATSDDGGARGEFIGIANAEDLIIDPEGNYMKL